jgi:hypothetical protein
MMISMRSKHPVINRTFCFFLCISFTLSMHAQKVDTSFMLLWYKGKKISDTSVLRPTGEIVSYSPSVQTVTVNYLPGMDPLQSYRTETARSDQAMVSIDEAIAGPGGDQAPSSFVVAANQAIEQARENMSTVLDNTIKIKPPPPIEPTVQEKVEWLKKWPSDVAANYSALIAYVNHPYSAEFTSNVAPPDYSYDYCYPCDAARNKAFHDDSLAFMNSFLSEEYEYLERAAAVMTYLQIPTLHYGVDSVLNSRARTNVFNAIVSITKRVQTKLIGVWNRYKNDQPKVPFIVDLLVTGERKQQLYGFETKGLPSFPELGMTLINTLRDVLTKASEEREYKILLNTKNLRFIRLAQQYGVKPEEFISIFEFLKWHEFKVNIDAKAKIEGKDLMEQAELHYEGIFLAYSDSTCRLKWSQKGADTVKNIVFDLKQIGLRAAQSTGTYTGLTKYGAKRPNIRLDFCDKARDTAAFYPFYGVDSWNFPRLPPGQEFQVVHRTFMATFMDEASLRKRAMSMQQSTMQEQVSSLEQQMGVSTANNSRPATMTPKDYERAAKLVHIEDEKLKFSWYNALYYFPVKGQLKNRAQVVFDETLDGKKVSKFPNTVYATFHVMIKHE